MKKGCLIALGVAVVLAAAILIFVFALTRGAVKSADDFLAQIGAGKIEAAYEETSATLRKQQTLASFGESVKELGLTDFASVFWSHREVKNDRAHLEGSVTTRSGGKVPLTMELVKEAGDWKVIYLSAPRAGVTTEQAGKTLPSDDAVKRLGLDSLLAFNRSVQARSFVSFYQQISRLWQEQVTPQKLDEIFADFINKQIDISSIKEVDPVLTEAPTINSDGILVLEGYYPTHPSKVYFRLKYIYEHPAWKLLGIKVKVGE
ncbi:MAG TPA: hypothetical protein VH207_11435 [Chthoniobacterales bacterium]|jgi:hypothetical protein|nr:hypothetical protein [Chthoniobacterales bacterium]